MIIPLPDFIAASAHSLPPSFRCTRDFFANPRVQRKTRNGNRATNLSGSAKYWNGSYPIHDISRLSYFISPVQVHRYPETVRGSVGKAWRGRERRWWTWKWPNGIINSFCRRKMGDGRYRFAIAYVRRV